MKNYDSGERIAPNIGEVIRLYDSLYHVVGIKSIYEADLTGKVAALPTENPDGPVKNEELIEKYELAIASSFPLTVVEHHDSDDLSSTISTSYGLVKIEPADGSFVSGSLVEVGRQTVEDGEPPDCKFFPEGGFSPEDLAVVAEEALRLAARGLRVVLDDVDYFSLF